MFKLLQYFQTDGKRELHKKLFKNHDHVELQILEKIKTFLNNETAEMEKICGRILKHLFLNKSLQPPFSIIYTFRQWL